MNRMMIGFAAGLCGASFVASASAQSIAVSLGVRETGTEEPIGADGGINDGIEWVNRDLTSIPLDGGWHLFSVSFPGAALTPFAGTTADGLYSTTRGVLEHLRLFNEDLITDPIRIYLDDLIVTDAFGNAFNLGWEGLPLGSEHIFQEPGLSGSTLSNLVDAGSSAVTDSMAYSGTQSYQVDFQFVDADPTNWLRLTTFASGDLTGGNPTIDFQGSLSFRIKGAVIPAPGAGPLACLLGAAGARRRRR
jgi:hypothetical protein